MSRLPASSRLPVVALVLAVFVLVPATGSLADQHESDAARVKYRQSVMSIIGTNMGAIGDIMKNRLPLPGAVANHAEQMADAAALIAPAFKKELHNGATDAKAKIWQDWSKFESQIQTFEDAARALAAADASGDAAATGKAMRTLGKSCGGCHKPFRKPKEESYKNR